MLHLLLAALLTISAIANVTRAIRHSQPDWHDIMGLAVAQALLAALLLP